MRTLIRNQGPDTGNVAKGFAAAVKLCQGLGVDELTLVVPSKGDLATTVVGEFLRAPAAKRLAKGELMKVNETMALRCESISTIQKAGRVSVALVFYVDVRGIRVIDGKSFALY